MLLTYEAIYPLEWVLVFEARVVHSEDEAVLASPSQERLNKTETLNFNTALL